MININDLGNIFIEFGASLKQMQISSNESADTKNDSQNGNVNDEYITRSELLEMYKPILTNYGLTQAIHMENFPYTKVGKKYYFKKEEVDKWLEARNSNNKSTTSIKYV